MQCIRCHAYLSGESCVVGLISCSLLTINLQPSIVCFVCIQNQMVCFSQSTDPESLASSAKTLLNEYQISCCSEFLLIKVWCWKWPDESLHQHSLKQMPEYPSHAKKLLIGKLHCADLSLFWEVKSTIWLFPYCCGKGEKNTLFVMAHKHSLHESIEITDCHSSYTVLLFFDKALVRQCFLWALAIIGNKSQMRKMKLFCTSSWCIWQPLINNCVKVKK